MPNHVTNIIKVDIPIRDLGESTWADIVRALTDAEGHVTFQNLVPSPECLANFEPNDEIISVAADIIAGQGAEGACARARRLAEDWPDVERALANHRKCGYTYWYDWNHAHWGTKWDAYNSTTVRENDPPITPFVFNTAWSHPGPIIKILASRFPTTTFAVIWADEDTGSNCGRIIIKGGEILDSEVAPASWPTDRKKQLYWTNFATEIDNEAAQWRPDVR